MKKQLLAFLSLLSVAHIDAYTIKVKNNTTAPIKVKADGGVGWHKEMTVASRAVGELSSGAICHSFIEISGSKRTIQLSYPVAQRCYNKELTIGSTSNGQDYTIELITMGPDRTPKYVNKDM